jgi:hypothetical protein
MSVSPVSELNLIDLTPRPFRWRMGLKPLDPAAWIWIDDRYEADVAEKRRLYRDAHDEVCATLPGIEGASREVVTALADHLVQHFPDRFGASAAAVLAGLPDGHPIEQAGLLVQEDLCLHTMVDGRLVLSAASLCFPTRWRLADKLGRPIDAIHGPVPRFDEITRNVDRVLTQLRVEHPVWRTNWSVMDDPALHQPVGPGRSDASSITAANAGERLWFRLERQTLRRFPIHDSVLFTIRVFQRSLAELTARPDVAAWLADAIRALPVDVASYKSIAPFADAAVEWLERMGSGESPAIGS